MIKLSFYNHTVCECKEQVEDMSTEITKDLGYKSAYPVYSNTSSVNVERYG